MVVLPKHTAQANRAGWMISTYNASLALATYALNFSYSGGPYV